MIVSPAVVMTFGVHEKHILKVTESGIGLSVLFVLQQSVGGTALTTKVILVASTHLCGT